MDNVHVLSFFLQLRPVLSLKAKNSCTLYTSTSNKRKVLPTCIWFELTMRNVQFKKIYPERQKALNIQHKRVKRRKTRKP